MTRPSARRSATVGVGAGAFGSVRTAVLALGHIAALAVSPVAPVSGSPVPRHPLNHLGLGASPDVITYADAGTLDHHDNVPEADGASRWVLYVFSMVLVLLGGAFAGLTIALMGQDSIYLQVLAGDPNEPQSKNARRVHGLLQRGKHWVLVTLLLSNVIVNETLPVVLDRCFGGGVAAVIGSTVLIVIFGEIVPQSVCVRYGLPIGGVMARPVLLLMYLMAPIGWPIAKLLDWVLGEDHGTVYKKSGLKTLVGLHQSLGDARERLNEDEVTIISAVLDLKGKQVGHVMTPMDDVFTVSEDTVLDERTMEKILSHGYSRIPVHATGQPTNFVGMLLVKILITYDPADAMRVKDFPLATLPETRPETSCLDIINFFQEGKSHMVLVSDSPGDDHGALGIVCLEDVIEELIGEEIIDESDVYIDVHKAIRRIVPAPKARPATKDTVAMSLADRDENIRDGHIETHNLSSSPRTTTFLLRRASADGQAQSTGVPLKAHFNDVRDSLRHLGPSNRAAHPRNTRSTAVKIKPGTPTVPTTSTNTTTTTITNEAPVSVGEVYVYARPAPRQYENDDDDDDDDDGDDDAHLNRTGPSETSPLLRSPPSSPQIPLLTGKNGVQALRQSYGSEGKSLTQSRLSGHKSQDHGVDHNDDDNNDVEHASSSTIRPATDIASTSKAADLIDLLPSRSRSDSLGRTSGSNTPPSNRIGPNNGLTEDLIEYGGVQKIVIRSASLDDSDSPHDGDVPSTLSAGISRPRTWNVKDDSDHNNYDVNNMSADSVVALVDKVDTETPLDQNAEPHSSVETPIAEAMNERVQTDDETVTDSVARPSGEPASNPFDAAVPAPPSYQQASRETTAETTPSPQQPSSPHPTSSLHPQVESVASPTRSDDVLSPPADPRSPIGGILEENEDLNASTASLAPSAGGGNNNGNGGSAKSGGKKKKGKKGRRGKGTAF